MQTACGKPALLVISVLLCLLNGIARAQAPGDVNTADPSSPTTLGSSSTKQPSRALASDTTVSVHQLSIPPNAQKALERGRRLLMDEHRAQDSLAAFRKAVQIAPDYWEAHFLLGIAYMGLRNWSDAELSLGRAISFNESLGPAYLALGSSLLEEGKFAEAEQRLLKGLELDPDAPHGHYDLSRAYYALTRFKEARLQALKALDLEPPKADAHFLLGNILLRLGDGDGALAQLQECIRLAPDSTFAAQARGQINRIESREISAR